MTDVPDDPEAFFAGYLPWRFDSIREAVTGKTSIGSVLFRVPGAGEWSIRLRDGELEVQREREDDVVVQVTIPATDFGPLISDGIRRSDGDRALASPGALRLLSLDAETARLVRRVRGSLLFAVLDGVDERRVLLTPGLGQADLEHPDCRIECKMEDFVDAQAGKVQPLQLFSQGKLKLSGNIQLALAISGVFS
jgi:hypothetical protein